MNTDKIYNSIEEVLDIAESAEGKTVGEFDINNRAWIVEETRAVQVRFQKGKHLKWPLIAEAEASQNFVDLGFGAKSYCYKRK